MGFEYNGGGQYDSGDFASGKYRCLPPLSGDTEEYAERVHSRILNET